MQGKKGTLLKENEERKKENNQSKEKNMRITFCDICHQPAVRDVDVTDHFFLRPTEEKPLGEPVTLCSHCLKITDAFLKMLRKKINADNIVTAKYDLPKPVGALPEVAPENFEDLVNDLIDKEADPFGISSDEEIEEV